MRTLWRVVILTYEHGSETIGHYGQESHVTLFAIRFLGYQDPTCDSVVLGQLRNRGALLVTLMIPLAAS